MKDKSLETAAMEWLHFKRKCPVVLWERSPVYNAGVPDVLGISSSRMRIEIEIKRSMADFRANSAKRHIAGRETWIHQAPWKFFFMVPSELSDRIIVELPDWAGLLTYGYQGIYAKQVLVIKESPQNKESKRMTVKECVRAAHKLANQVIALSMKFQTPERADAGLSISHPGGNAG